MSKSLTDFLKRFYRLPSTDGYDPEDEGVPPKDEHIAHALGL